MQREKQRREPSTESESRIPRLVLVEEQEAAPVEGAAASAAGSTQAAAGPALIDPSAIHPDDAAGAQQEVQASPPEVVASLPTENIGAMGTTPQAVETAAASIDAEVNREAPSPTEFCYTLGPFPKREDAETIRQLLQLSASATNVRREAQEQHIGYWVVIPPLETESEAIAKVRALKAAGITDVWRFTRGSLANAISLGLFAREKLARTHSENISSKGFATDVRPRYAERSTYWIDARYGKPQDTADGVWSRIIKDHPETQAAPAKCEL